MGNETVDVLAYNDIKELLNSYGDFHDSSILCLIQNFQEKRLEIHIDNLFSGLESNLIQPGIIIFEKVEYLFCNIPYVGGDVRIEGVELFRTKDGFKLKFELTTTEWMDSEEFKIIKVDVITSQMSIQRC